MGQVWGAAPQRGNDTAGPHAVTGPMEAERGVCWGGGSRQQHQGRARLDAQDLPRELSGRWSAAVGLAPGEHPHTDARALEAVTWESPSECSGNTPYRRLRRSGS